MKREAISKKIRFEVFKRDSFTCQYCGKHPPEVTLEIDHIKPIALGGTSDINNLITACFGCNRGKGKTELKQITNSMMENKEIIEERERQYIEYHKLLAKVRKRVESEIDSVVEIFEEKFKNQSPTEKFKINTIKMFIEKIGVFNVIDAMTLACDYIGGEGYSKADNFAMKRGSDCLRYFCGICWKKLRSIENG